MKIPKIVKLNIPGLINAASGLKGLGKLAVSKNNLLYLDIDDEYVHQLFPFFQDQEIKKPDYFNEGSAGAHISVIYPEENQAIDKKHLGKSHNFLINDIVSAELGPKKYYVLLVTSPSLLQLRRKYALSDELCFKGYSIGFHVTIGVGPNL